MARKGSHFQRYDALADYGWLRVLTGKEVSLWYAYLKHADKEGIAYPSAQTLADMLGHRNSNHIARLRSALVRYGLLAVITEGGGRGHRCMVRVLTPGPVPKSAARKRSQNGKVSHQKHSQNGTRNTPNLGQETLPKRETALREEQPSEQPIEQITEARASVPALSAGGQRAKRGGGTVDDPLERETPPGQVIGVNVVDDGRVTMKPAGRRQPGTPQAELVDYFRAGFSVRYGGAKYPARSVDYVKAHELLKAVEGVMEDAKAAIDRFLADDWPAGQRHPLNLMLGASMLPRYLIPAQPIKHGDSHAKRRTAAERGEFPEPAASLPTKRRWAG